MKEKSVLDSMFYKVLRYGSTFLFTNLLFLVANIPFFLVFFSIPLLVENVLWYGAALLPAGPALGALFFCMGLLVRENVISPFRDFWRAYRSNFFISLKFWGIQLVILLILGVDMLYFLSNGNTIAGILFGFTSALTALLTVNGLSLLATFDITLANIYRASIVSLFRGWKKQLLNLLTLVAFAFILYAFPSQFFLFIFSLTAYYFMRNYQGLFEELAHQFSKERGDEDEED